MSLKGLTPGVSLASFPSPIPPVSGGGLPSPLDWSAYQTIYDWTGTPASIPATSYGTFLNITGEGFLLFARGDSAVSASRNPDMRITVDGVAYVFNGVDKGIQVQGNVLMQPIYYKTSLKIEVFNRGVSAQNLRCDYTYLSKKGSPSKNQTLLTASNRKMEYAENATTSNTDVVSVVGSGYLLDIEFSGFYVSTTSFVNGTVTIDSIIKMNDRPTFDDGGATTKQGIFTGPIRFETNFKVQHRAFVTGTTALTRVWYVLD